MRLVRIAVAGETSAFERVALLENEVSQVDGIALLTVFVLAVFVGYEVISKVSSTLHTPLMSGSNAISGIVLVGTIAVAAHTESTVIFVLELVAIVLASVNLVGGFVVTDRMLRMFRSRGRRDKA
jgi:H+-translocating NAD(P) transhydrogenase subunit alpha